MSTRAIGWYAAITLLSLGYFTYNFRLSRADLTAPLCPAANDSAALLSLVKSIQESGWPWVVERVGAPGVAERFDYPLPEHAHYLFLRSILQFTDNPFLAFNLWAILSYPLVAVCSLAVLRAIGLSSPIAFALAMVYAFLPYHAGRVFSHTMLAHYHTVPLILLPAIWITQGRLPFFKPLDEFGRRRLNPFNATTAWTIVLGAIVATTSPYYAFFGCFFLAVAGLYRSLSDWSWRPILAGLGTAAFVSAIGFACAWPFLRHQWEHGPNPAVAQRNPNEAEVYSLKVTQLVLPFGGHRIGAIGHFTQLYNAEAPLSNENRDSVLGFIGATGFLILLGRLLMARAGPTLLGGLAILNVAAILLGATGGFGAIFNFAVFPQIRCYNRVCVFIAFWSLLTVGLLVERWAGGSPKRIWLAALGLLAFGLFDLTSQRQAPNHAQLQANHVAWAGFVNRVEDSLPPGSMVFQLPAASYPEAGVVHKMPDYAHLACHGYSRTLRWSFGTNRNRRWAEWHEYVASRPTPEMLELLALADFAAVYVDRRGFADNGVALVSELRERLGTEFVSSDAGEQLVFKLERVRAELNTDELARRRTDLLNRPFVMCQAGFLPWATTNPPEPRRVGHVATMRLVNPGTRSRSVTLTMNWQRHMSAELAVTVNGLGVDRSLVPPTMRGRFEVELELPPGEHILSFTTGAKPPGPGRFHTAWTATDIKLAVRD